MHNSFNIYRQIYKWIARISPRLNTQLNFKRVFGRWPDLNHPKTFNEKVMWLKLNTYLNDPLVEQCVDKYAVRKYVAKQGCGEILNELLGVWTNPDEVDFDALPNQFALKCNYYYNLYIICSDKSKLDISKAREEMKRWLRSDDHLALSEMQYGATPKKIIAEKFIETEDGLAPADYKVYCSEGKAQYVMVCVGREPGVKPNFYYFDLDGNLRREFTQEGLDAPADFHYTISKEWKQMISYAEKLAAPFPFVRADFYIEGGKIIFGELTFTPAAGLGKKLDYTEKTLGEMIHLPQKKQKR